MSLANIIDLDTFTSADFHIITWTYMAYLQVYQCTCSYLSFI